MQGSWLTQHKYSYAIVDSTHSSDAKRKLFTIQTLDDGALRFASRTEILTNRTMYLIGLQALNTVHVWLGKAVYMTRTIPAQVQIKGAIVDCLLHQCESTEIEEMVRQTFAEWAWRGQAIARVRTLKDALGATLKESRPTAHHSSWV